MDKFIWGISQAITSGLFFLLQLAFLKSKNLSEMAVFSTLFGLMNFVILMIRRALIEITIFQQIFPGISSFSLLTLSFFLCSLPISFFFHGNKFLTLYISIFLTNQVALDILRFSSLKNHYKFIGIQSASIFIILGSMSINFSEVNSFLSVTILQMFVTIYYVVTEQKTRLKINQMIKLFNLSRLVDFFVSSGFGFLLPLITLILLDQKSVGVLRTSQNFLNLGSIFTAAYYYSILANNNRTNFSKYFHFLPSILLFIILLISDNYVQKSTISQIFGPYFHESLNLTILLIIALIPSIFASTLNAFLINMKKFKELLRIHVFSVFVLAVGSIIGFVFIGVTAFGLFSIISASLEIFLIRKKLEVRI